jgi:hypothetical protein
MVFSHQLGTLFPALTGSVAQVSWFEEVAPESAAGILAYLSHGCVCCLQLT